MGATASPTIINDIATTVILNFNFQVFINLLFYSAAATTGVLATSKIITIAFEELIKALCYRWETKYNDRKALASAVTKIINEGSTSSWRNKPRDMEHVNFIARLLDGVDKKASSHFDKYITCWQMYAIEIGKTHTATEDIKFRLDLQKEAQESSTNTQKIVQKWL